MNDTPPVIRDKPEKPPEPARGPNVVPLWLAVVAVAALAAWPLLQPRQGADEARLAKLEASLAAMPKGESEALARRLEENAANARVLAERLARLESAGASKDALGKIEESQDALQSQSRSLAERLAKSAAETERALRAQAESLERIEKRLSIAEAKIEAGTGAPAALALAYGQLREALRRSAPFAEDLERFRALAKDEAAIRAATDALALRARDGVASLEEIRGRFAEVARNAARLTAKGTDGLWDHFLDRLSTLVVIRRVGEVAGETAEAIVARAEARLGAGDLAAAIAEVEKLSGEAAERAADWLKIARARLALDRAQAEIEALIAERLGKAAGRP